MDTTLAHLCTLSGIPEAPEPAVATRQNSSNGRPKSPRIQVVLPEELCQRLADLAEGEARTVSNMARVLIQQGVERLERQLEPTDRFRAALEQQQARPQRLRGAPRRLRLRPPR
jgi:predicted DNA-binding protein